MTQITTKASKLALEANAVITFIYICDLFWVLIFTFSKLKLQLVAKEWTPGQLFVVEHECKRLHIAEWERRACAQNDTFSQYFLHNLFQRRICKLNGTNVIYNIADFYSNSAERPFSLQSIGPFCPLSSQPDLTLNGFNYSSFYFSGEK